MEHTTVRCPSCGANLDVLEGKNIQFCQYCGVKIPLVRNETPETNVDVDVAHDVFGIGKAVSSYFAMKNREKELEYEKKMAEEQYLRDHPEVRRRDTVLLISFVIGFVALIIILSIFVHD